MSFYGNYHDLNSGLRDIAKGLESVARAQTNKPPTYNVIVNTAAVDPDAVAQAVTDALTRTERREATSRK